MQRAVQVPAGWQLVMDPSGRPLLYNPMTRETVPANVAPVSAPTATNNPQGSVAEAPLPPGWEKSIDAQGRAYFIDHNNQRTTWEDPRGSAAQPRAQTAVPVPMQIPLQSIPGQMPVNMPIQMPMGMPMQPMPMPMQMGTSPPMMVPMGMPMQVGGVPMGMPIMMTSNLGPIATGPLGTVQMATSPPRHPISELICDSKPPEVWSTKSQAVADSVANAPACARCGALFGAIFTRKRLCRCCGRHFCDNCTPQRSDIPSLKLSNARVCIHCQHHLNVRHDAQCVGRVIPFLTCRPMVPTRMLTAALQECLTVLPKETDKTKIDTLNLITPLMEIIKSSSPAVSDDNSHVDSQLLRLSLRVLNVVLVNSNADTIQNIFLTKPPQGNATASPVSTPLTDAALLAILSALTASPDLKEDALLSLAAMAIYTPLKPILEQHALVQPLLRELGSANPAIQELSSKALFNYARASPPGIPGNLIDPNSAATVTRLLQSGSPVVVQHLIGVMETMTTEISSGFEFLYRAGAWATLADIVKAVAPDSAVLASCINALSGIAIQAHQPTRSALLERHIVGSLLRHVIVSSRSRLDFCVNTVQLVAGLIRGADGDQLGILSLPGVVKAAVMEDILANLSGSGEGETSKTLLNLLTDSHDNLRSRAGHSILNIILLGAAVPGDAAIRGKLGVSGLIPTLISLLSSEEQDMDGDSSQGDTLIAALALLQAIIKEHPGNANSFVDCGGIDSLNDLMTQFAGPVKGQVIQTIATVAAALGGEKASQMGLVQLLLNVTPLTLPPQDPQLLEAVVEAIAILSTSSRECRDQIFNSGEAENLVALLGAGEGFARIQMSAVRLIRVWASDLSIAPMLSQIGSAPPLQLLLSMLPQTSGAPEVRREVLAALASLTSAEWAHVETLLSTGGGLQLIVNSLGSSAADAPLRSSIVQIVHSCLSQSLSPERRSQWRRVVLSATGGAERLAVMAIESLFGDDPEAVTCGLNLLLTLFNNQSELLAGVSGLSAQEGFVGEHRILELLQTIGGVMALVRIVASPRRTVRSNGLKALASILRLSFSYMQAGQLQPQASNWGLACRATLVEQGIIAKLGRVLGNCVAEEQDTKESLAEIDACVEVMILLARTGVELKAQASAVGIVVPLAQALVKHPPVIASSMASHLSPVGMRCLELTVLISADGVDPSSSHSLVLNDNWRAIISAGGVPLLLILTASAAALADPPSEAEGILLRMGQTAAVKELSALAQSGDIINLADVLLSKTSFSNLMMIIQSQITFDPEAPPMSLEALEAVCSLFSQLSAQPAIFPLLMRKDSRYLRQWINLLESQVRRLSSAKLDPSVMRVLIHMLGAISRLPLSVPTLPPNYVHHDTFDEEEPEEDEDDHRNHQPDPSSQLTIRQLRHIVVAPRIISTAITPLLRAGVWGAQRLLQSRSDQLCLSFTAAVLSCLAALADWSPVCRTEMMQAGSAVWDAMTAVLSAAGSAGTGLTSLVDVTVASDMQNKTDLQQKSGLVQLALRWLSQLVDSASLSKELAPLLTSCKSEHLTVLLRFIPHTPILILIQQLAAHPAVSPASATGSLLSSILPREQFETIFMSLLQQWKQPTDVLEPQAVLSVSALSPCLLDQTMATPGVVTALLVSVIERLTKTPSGVQSTEVLRDLVALLRIPAHHPNVHSPEHASGRFIGVLLALLHALFGSDDRALPTTLTDTAISIANAVGSVWAQLSKADLSHISEHVLHAIAFMSLTDSNRKLIMEGEAPDLLLAVLRKAARNDDTPITVIGALYTVRILENLTYGSTTCASLFESQIVKTLLSVLESGVHGVADPELQGACLSALRQLSLVPQTLATFDSAALVAIASLLSNRNEHIVLQALLILSNLAHSSVCRAELRTVIDATTLAELHQKSSPAIAPLVSSLRFLLAL